MTDAPEKVAVPRDRELEASALAAVIADRNDQPRSRQVAVGPSSIGFCRALLRAQLFEPDNALLLTPETTWATAAHVGSVMGADLERVFGQRLGALEQQRMTTFFDKVGVHISGAIDLMFLQADVISDLKSMDDVGSLLYDLDKNTQIIETLRMIYRNDALYDWWVETADGKHELTQKLLNSFSKLHYWVQVAVYVTGAIQQGVLSPAGEGRLVFYDRSGDFQEFVAVVLDPEVIAMFFEIGQRRVLQAAQAQELYEQTGNPGMIFSLRDQQPSFCFSPKVMCPLREWCWGGSEWTPTADISSPDQVSAAERYDEGRRLAKIGEGMKKSAREELKGVDGVTPDGLRVSWRSNTISVVQAKVDATKPARSAVDIAAESMARVAIKPEAVVDEVARDPRLDRVHFVDTDPRPSEPTPIERVLEAPELTERQRAWLESKKDVDPAKAALENLQSGVAADKAARKREREGKK